MARITASVDIGGTFTDIIIQEDGRIAGYYKVPTTARQPEVGVSSGLKQHLHDDISELVHATTIATNALLGQFGLELPEVALITTRGFRDTIEIGRQNRPSLYDLFFRKPRTLVPRESRYEVEERVTSSGEIMKGLSEDELRKVAHEIKEKKIRSVAVTFLNSYLNPENERIASGILSEMFEYLSISNNIAPEQREYERTSTTVVNAALMPLVSRYIRNLEQSISSFGDPDLSIMASSGGLVSTEEVYARPVQIVESGPAAGVIASSEMSKILGISNIISFDMGGTTAKAGTVVDSQVLITSEYEVGGESHHGRMTKGSGYPVRFPFIDLAEVSAGGGTIIWKDAAGGLRIGPMSSGAEPGPICYGKGGVEPTITDANLAMGVLGETLLGGEMRLDKEGALRGLSKLGDPYEVAESALNLADLEMARAIRIVTVERGLDPSDFTMIGFGGAGPQHAARIADELGITHVVIPPRAGLFSALGLLFSDWRYEARASFPADPQKSFVELEKNLKEEHGEANFLRYADCRYRGQGSELTVPVSDGSRDSIISAFRELHQSTFGFSLNRDVEIVTVRVFAVIARNKPSIGGTSTGSMGVSEREAVINGSRVRIKAYERPGMPHGQEVKGPCSVDDYDSTTFVPEGWTASPGKMGELNLRRVK